MKKILNTFKKSEVAIYAIAIMLVAAGYLNYTTMNNTMETSSKEVENIQNSVNKVETEDIDFKEVEEENIANIGDAELVSSNEVIENTSQNKNEEDDENTVEVANIDENDYFASSKLERDKTYASMISNYTTIMEKDKIQEAEKKMAMQEITNINNTKNAIMICENVLSTKGFENSVVFVNDKSINVIVKVKDGISKEKVAQIQNIVSRELNAEIANIHITEK